MKIAFVVNNFPPRTGGVELHVQALAQELAALGHTSVVITLGARPEREFRGPVEVRTLKEHFRIADILGFPSLGTTRRLAKALQAESVDLVSVHTRFFPMSYVGQRAAQLAGIPVIHTEHGSDHVASSSLIIKYASRAVDFTVGRAVLRNADRVLGVSEDVCRFVRRLAGVDAQLFYNAIHFDPRQADPTKIDPRPDRLVFVGRLVPGKGWEHFLEAVREQQTQAPGVTGDVVGGGSDLQALKTRVHELGLGEVVTVHGRVNQARVREILRGATLVNPTVLAEGFQTTLLEAIAEGGRVATFPVPGAKALLSDGAPVRIAHERTAEALSAEVAALRQSPPPASSRALVEAWGWNRRAKEYEQIAAEVVSHSRAK